MKQERFNEIITNLKLERNKWIDLNEISSIVLSDGRGIYPNWKYLRFMILESSILVKHGDSEPYGARLVPTFNPSYDYESFSFPLNAIQSTSYYSTYRLPETGDILRATYDSTTLWEAYILECVKSMNGLIIKTGSPHITKKPFHLSFYDPEEYDEGLCMHSTEVEGVYMKFKENKGKIKKGLGAVEEIIKVKNIQEINLRVGCTYYNKTYKLT